MPQRDRLCWATSTQPSGRLAIPCRAPDRPLIPSHTSASPRETGRAGAPQYELWRDGQRQPGQSRIQPSRATSTWVAESTAQPVRSKQGPGEPGHARPRQPVLSRNQPRRDKLIRVPGKLVTTSRSPDSLPTPGHANPDPTQTQPGPWRDRPLLTYKIPAPWRVRPL